MVAITHRWHPVEKHLEPSDGAKVLIDEALVVGGFDGEVPPDISSWRDEVEMEGRHDSVK